VTQNLTHYITTYEKSFYIRYIRQKPKYLEYLKTKISSKIKNC